MSGTKESKISGLPCVDSTASFWHSEPSKFLLGHRTTNELPSEADIVVVGSGITGASAARYLAEDARAKGMNIVMLEAREACWGATGRNGGHCQPLLFDRTPEVAAFEVRNVAEVESYITEFDVPCEWRKSTSCRAYFNKNLLKTIQDEIKHLQQTKPDIGKHVKVSTDSATLRQHHISTHAAGITLTEGAASLWPYKYVAFVLEKLVRDGSLNLQTNTPATSITSESSNSTHRRTITTPRGTIRAKHIILATNGYTSHLLPAFGSLIVPVRCEMSALHPPKRSSRLENSYGFVGARGQNPDYDDYLIQRPFYDSPNGDGIRRGGHLMFGGGRGSAKYPCVGVSDDDVVDTGEARYLREMLLEVMSLDGETEGLEELKASHQWTGIKGYSRDDMPWVGKVPDEEGVWLCGGYTGHGMPNATLCGKAVVDMLLSTSSATSSREESYETVCRRLVDAGDLPSSYVLTPERVKQALALPTVAERETEWDGVGGKKELDGGRCCMM